jgi:hypothetical protein
MADPPQGTRPKYNWRWAVLVGVAIGVGLHTSRWVQQALEPSIGKFGANSVSLAAAAVAAGLVAGLILLLLKLAEKDRT